MYKYEEIFNIGNNEVINKVKIRTIQAMIQIERPVDWPRYNIERI
jgi:hypothetical protein